MLHKIVNDCCIEQLWTNRKTVHKHFVINWTEILSYLIRSIKHCATPPSYFLTSPNMKTGSKINFSWALFKVGSIINYIISVTSGLSSNNLLQIWKRYVNRNFEAIKPKKKYTDNKYSEAIAGFNISITGAVQLWQLECVNTPDKSTSLYPTS